MLENENQEQILPWKKRRALIVWMHTLRPLRQLRKFGIISYVSRQMKYVLIYMDEVSIEKNMSVIEKLNFVRRVELSYRPDVSIEYSKIDLEDDDGFDVEELSTTIKLSDEV